MGSFMTNNETLGSVVFKDFKSKVPVDVKAIRVDDEIYFQGKDGAIYSARQVRREKWAFPLGRQHIQMLHAFLKLGVLKADEHKRIIALLDKKFLDQDIKRAKQDMKDSGRRLKNLLAKKKARTR